MRKIINSTYITTDGAVEGPHLWPSVGDSQGRASVIQTELLQACDAVLMGRRTYESFAAAWTTRSGDPLSDRMNAMPKYVVSTTLRDPAWTNTTVIRDDVPGELARLKQRPGGDIVQYGIGPVTYTLLEHGLLDELRLWVHPLILGRTGPTVPHFVHCPPTHLRLIEAATLPNGIAILRYDVTAPSAADRT
jgi:dihydrofolate reductase